LDDHYIPKILNILFADNYDTQYRFYQIVHHDKSFEMCDVEPDSFEINICKMEHDKTFLNYGKLYNISSDMLVSDIKFLIFCLKKIPVQCQHITFNEIILDDDNTLEYYQIMSKSLIYLETINDSLV
jgi:hypothetical protein